MTIPKTELSTAEQALLLQRLQKAHTKKTDIKTISPMPPGELVPLSFAQQRLWFLYQWEPTNPTYNIPLSWHIEGSLDIVALRSALDELIDRHKILQMCFVAAEDVFLEFHPDPRITLDIVDLSTTPVDKWDSEAKRLAFEEARKPFDLERDLPFRAGLIRLSETEHVLLLTLHHIIADGWSVGLLRNELAQLYTSFEANQPSPLPDLPIQYPDFAYWQRSWLRGDILIKQLDYWKRQLAGVPKALGLPTDRPRPAMLTHNGAIHSFQLETALSHAVYACAQREEVTPFMILLAAYQILLHRYTAQDDIVVGSPIAGRTRSETEGLIGCFINTLVLRTKFSKSLTVRELLKQVRDTTLDAFSHQDLPFERLIEELQPERDLSYTPIFQAMIVFEKISRSSGLQLPGLKIQPLGTNSSTAKFDLTLAFSDYGDNIAGSMTYNTDLFDPDTIDRMMGHFEVLLEGTVSNPDQPIDCLPILTVDESQQLLVEWNQTRVDFPQARCVHQLFETQVEQTPDHIAVVCEGNHYTYRELNERANRLAYYLQSQGVGPEVRVGLFMDRSLEIVVGLLGILKAGGAYVPVDPLYPVERLRFILQSAQTPILLTQSHLATSLPALDGVKVVSLDDDWDTIGSHPGENPPVTASLDNLMYVLFTSGSTGQPKGVAVQHRSYFNYLSGFLKQIDVPGGLSYAIVSTFAADLGTPMIYGALCTGGQLHIIPYERAIDPDAMADYFQRHRIDVIKLVPSHFEAWLTALEPASVVPHQRLILAGEASHWETIATVRQLLPEVVIQNHYGPTETTVSVLAYPVPDQVPESQPLTVPIGRPLGNIRTYILDANLQPVPRGVPGELYLGGAGLARGYLGNPDLTAERFLPDPFSQEPGNRIYRTGDLARYLPDGAIEFLGRVDFQVKIRGYRIEPGEIESLIGQYPGIQDVAVTVREDSPGDKRLVAYIVPQADMGDNGLIDHLRSSLREQVPDYMVPAAFVKLEALPLNPNGKLDRQALPLPDPAQLQAGNAFIAPRNELEERIASIWSSVLGVEKIGINDNFFDLGGESFKAIKVARKIDDAFSVIDLFKYPTVRQLAEHLSDGQTKSAGILCELTRPVQVNEKIVNLVCIPYGGGSSFMYKTLADHLPANYSLYGVEIPGHDFSRRDEPLIPITETALLCADEIRRDLSGPIVLYGHCVGGALTLEIARLLEASGVDMLGVIMGGTFPNPRLPGKFLGFMNELFSNERWMSDRLHRDFLVAMGGLVDMVSPEEQTFVVKGLRHDAREAEDYFTGLYAQEDINPLNAPILCVVGERDRTTRFYQEQVKEWGNFSPSVNLAEIPNAGHYFLKYQADELAQIIENQTTVWKQPPQPDLLPIRRLEADEKQPGTHIAISIRPSLSLFFMVALGQFVSIIGTGLSGFALGIWVYQQTKSVSLLGIIAAFTLVPGIITLPFAGAVADRFDRRKVMLFSDAIAGVGTLVLAYLLWVDSLQIWHICALTATGAIANAFQRPAYMAAVAQLVPKRYLGQANGIVQLGGAVSNLVSPLLGGVLIVSIGLYGIVLVDFATFLFAAGVLLFIRFPNTMFRRQEEPILKAIVGGWRFIIRRYNLVVMVVFFIVFNYLDSIAQVLITPLALSFGSPELLGIGVSAAGLGVLFASILMSLWGGTRRRATGMIGSAVLAGVAITIMGVRPVSAFLVGGLFCYGFAMLLLNTHWLTMIQTKVGLELQGRVLATNQMLATIMMPLGALTAGPLVDKLITPMLTNENSAYQTLGELVGTGPGRAIGLVMALLGILMAIWSIVGLRYRPLRYMEDELPDALPDSVITADKDLLQEQVDRRLKEGTT